MYYIHGFVNHILQVKKKLMNLGHAQRYIAIY